MKLVRLNENVFINPGIIGLLEFVESRDDAGFTWRIIIKDLQAKEVYKMELKVSLAERDKITRTRAELEALIRRISSSKDDVEEIDA